MSKKMIRELLTCAVSALLFALFITVPVLLFLIVVEAAKGAIGITSQDIIVFAGVVFLFWFALGALGIIVGDD